MLPSRLVPAALGRASLVGMLLTYAALTLGVCGLSRAAHCLRAPERASTAAEETALWAFLGPVSPGMSIGPWTIAQVYPPRGGALVVHLRPASGPDLALAVTRLDPHGPRPLARTAHLAVILAEPAPPSSAGDAEPHVSSASLTPPAALAAAAALAEALAAREAAYGPPPLGPLTP